MTRKYTMVKKFRTNTKIYKGTNGDKDFIQYNCPKCGKQQTHLWFGRDKHYCNDCEYVTEIVGEIIS